jgi:hypothetical protein
MAGPDPEYDMVHSLETPSKLDLRDRTRYVLFWLPVRRFNLRKRKRCSKSPSGNYVVPTSRLNVWTWDRARREEIQGAFFRGGGTRLREIGAFAAVSMVMVCVVVLLRRQIQRQIQNESPTHDFAA